VAASGPGRSGCASATGTGAAQTVVTTRPTPNGGTTVRSVSVTQGLKGTGLVSGVSYRAVELSGTVVNHNTAEGVTWVYSYVTPTGGRPSVSNDGR
jgi:hypothetical protein